MTDIEKYEPPASDLVRFAEEASQIHGISKALANTSFVPKAFQGKPDEITAAILAGRELNLPPMTALRAIDVIQGTPAISANAQRGLAQSAGVEFELIESTQTRCVMRARRRGKTAWTEVTWDVARADKMGLTGKDNWKKQPQSMLIARATSELCRLEAADVIYAMPYSQEELKDGDAAAVATAVPTAGAASPPAKRTAQREPIQATVPTPTPPPPPPPPPPAPVREIGPPPADSVAPRAGRNSGHEITDTTRKAIMASFNDLNIRDRNTRMAVVSRILGWDVPSVNMLTEDEGKKVVHAAKNTDRVTLLAAVDAPAATPPPAPEPVVREAAAIGSWGVEETHDWSDVEVAQVAR